MDLYTPEISCQCGDNQTGIPSTAITNGLGVDLAKNTTAARAYDELHVQAIVNQINGKHSSGNYPMQMPNLFGLNFQAVSVGQKVSRCLTHLASQKTLRQSAKGPDCNLGLVLQFCSLVLVCPS